MNPRYARGYDKYEKVQKSLRRDDLLCDERLEGCEFKRSSLCRPCLFEERFLIVLLAMGGVERLPYLVLVTIVDNVCWCSLFPPLLGRG